MAFGPSDECFTVIRSLLPGASSCAFSSPKQKSSGRQQLQLTCCGLGMGSLYFTTLDVHTELLISASQVIRLVSSMSV